MAPDAPQQNVRVTAQRSELVGEIVWQDAVAAEPSIHFDIHAQRGEPSQIGTHQLANHCWRRCGNANACGGSVAQVGGGNAPEDTHRASDPSVTQLLCLIKCGDQYRSRASIQCSTRNRHSAKAVGVGLQHHVEVTASRELPLKGTDIRCDRIEPHLYPGITPERRQANLLDTFGEPAHPWAFPAGSANRASSSRRSALMRSIRARSAVSVASRSAPICGGKR